MLDIDIIVFCVDVSQMKVAIPILSLIVNVVLMKSLYDADIKRGVPCVRPILALTFQQIHSECPGPGPAAVHS